MQACVAEQRTSRSGRGSSETPSTARQAICKANLLRGGFSHIDIAEVQAAEGKLYLFVGIDRTSKFAFTQLVKKADRKTAWEFLEHLLKAGPYHIHTILTDNGIQFAE